MASEAAKVEEEEQAAGSELIGTVGWEGRANRHRLCRTLSQHRERKRERSENVNEIKSAVVIG